MPRCIDYPCCGHSDGDCPRIDKDGNEAYTCVCCGVDLEAKARSSICNRCLKQDAIWSEDDFYQD